MSWTWWQVCLTILTSGVAVVIGFGGTFALVEWVSTRARR